jgi:small ligand-binding sensory domain FIST
MFSATRRIFTNPKHSRSYWTKLTSTGSTIEECLQVSLAALKDKTPDVCVVLASKSFSFKHYQNLTHELRNKLKPTILLGGVVDRVPQVDHGISLLLGFDEHIVPFAIEDSDSRLKIRSISVGRWGRKEEKDRVKLQSDHIDKFGWDNFGSVSTPAQTYQLPAGIIDPPSFVMTVSDNEPDELLQALDHHFPQVPKVGIIGASTPFVTGTPYTLFSSEKMMGSGIVGFASYGKASKEVKVSHTSLEKLGEPVKITRCRGNIILDLDESGATGLLLRLIQGGPKLSKDEEFYLGVYPPNEDQTSESNVTVSRITSGDPSKGNMAVDTTTDLQVGQVVQVKRKETSSIYALV